MTDVFADVFGRMKHTNSLLKTFGSPLFLYLHANGETCPLVRIVETTFEPPPFMGGLKPRERARMIFVGTIDEAEQFAHASMREMVGA